VSKNPVGELPVDRRPGASIGCTAQRGWPALAEAGPKIL
ncbi:uncharacterized protein METZ01_LOCUS357410, partial [marine metagenome]